MRFRLLVVCAFSVLGPALAQELMRLKVDPPLAKRLTDAATAAGLRCEELKGLYLVGPDERGTVMLAKCGPPNAPAIDSASLWVHATDSGYVRIRPWDQQAR